MTVRILNGVPAVGDLGGGLRCPSNHAVTRKSATYPGITKCHRLCSRLRQLDILIHIHRIYRIIVYSLRASWPPTCSPVVYVSIFRPTPSASFPIGCVLHMILGSVECQFNIYGRTPQAGGPHRNGGFSAGRVFVVLMRD